MNLQRTYLLIFLILPIFLKCSRFENSVREIESVTLPLIEKNEISFQLDSASIYFSPMIQYVEGSNEVFILNTFNNAIYVYDYSEQRLNRILHYDSVSNRRIGPLSGFKVIGEDSTVLVLKNSHEILLVGNDGRLLKSYKLNSGNLLSTCVNPIIFKAPKIYVSCFLGNGVDPFKPQVPTENLVCEIDLTKDIVRYIYSYPKEYSIESWGLYMFDFFVTYNSHTGNFVYSFPICGDIIETDHAGFLERKPANISREFKPRPFQGSDFSSEMRIKQYLLSPSYGPIIYDEYRELYYRLYYEELSEEEYNLNHPQRSRMKYPTVIVFDKNFVKIGESHLPRFDYTEQMIFVTREGLNIGKWSKSKTNPDLAYFAVFEIQEK